MHLPPWHTSADVNPDTRKIVVWTLQTFEYNFGMKDLFTKYLKESFWLDAD